MKFKYNTIRINLFFIICIVFLFGLFAYKLGVVALNDEVEGTNLAELAANRSTATKILTANRGNIYDRTGKETLAQNINSYTIVAYLSEKRTSDERYPKHVKDKEMTAKKLAEVLAPNKYEDTYKTILKLLNQSNLYQTYLGSVGKGITENVKRKIEELALPGIDFIKESKRYYPNSDFASYIIGYAKTNEETGEIKGELGIEGYCDRYLKGKDGSITYQRDAYGYQLADKYSKTVEAQDGYDVYLTLDHQVQIFLDNAVEEFAEFDPSWVTITVADAETGAIIGSSTSPSYNPNKLNITNYNNPLTSFTYEPGSTMKIFSFMSAMEEGKYDGSATYPSGSIKVDNYNIHDWNKSGWGTITYDVGFTYSSNTAAVRLAQAVKRNKLHQYYSDLGFGELTGIELSGELKGDIDFTYNSELASVSYGQGMTVTPIQMIQALSTITNDGTVMKPYIIDKIVDPNTGEVVYQGKKTELKKVYSTSTVNKIKELMDLTVNGEDKAATGRVYQTDAVRLIGKTGTANYTGSNGQYVKGTYNTIRSFAGVFPYDKPEYIIYVSVKDFKGSSKNMGNIVKKLVESVAKYRNLDERPSDIDSSKIVTIDNYLNKDTKDSVSKLQAKGISSIVIGDGNKVINQYPKKDTKTSQKARVFLVTNGNKVTMPDIIGWSSNEFIDFCKLVGVKYELDGYGYITSSNIEVGTVLNENTVIAVKLKNIEPESLVTKEESGENGDNKENNN